MLPIFPFRRRKRWSPWDVSDTDEICNRGRRTLLSLLMTGRLLGLKPWAFHYYSAYTVVYSGRGRLAVVHRIRGVFNE